MTWIQRPAWILVALVLATAAPAAQSDLTLRLENADTVLRSDPAKARPLFESALAEARASGREAETGRALFGLAASVRRAGDSAGAQGLLVEALAIFERLGDQTRSARTCMQLAHLEPDLARAGAWFDRAAATARAAGNTDLEGSARHNYGDRLFATGRYEEAVEQLSRAAAVYDGAGAREDLGTVYNSMGRIYRAHGRIDEALKYQQAALALHRTTTESGFTLVQSLNAVASVYQRMGDLASARSYMEEAIAASALMKGTSETLRIQDTLRANMASMLGDLGQHAAAAAALEQVIGGGRDEFLSIRYMQLSDAYRGLGRQADALVAAEQAVALCGESPTTCIAAYNTRANSQAALGNREAARRDLSLTLDSIEGLRARLLPSDSFKQDFSSSYSSAYSSAIRQQLDGGRELEALETAELARSRAFLDLLASRHIAPAAAAASPALTLTLRGERAVTSVASPSVTSAAKTADLVRTATRLRSTLLLYWVGADETVIWVVRPDRAVQARRVKVTRTRLIALVRDTAPFADSQGTRAPAALRESSSAWRALYTLLIAPVRSDLPSTNGALLTIVPHGVLSDLSFAALQDNSGRYLLEDYSLHYAPAGALFQFTAAQRRAEPRSGPILMVADPDPSRRSTLDAPLPRLPGARAEALAITRQFPKGRVLSLTGAAATETAVRAEAPSRSILHFAAHAVVREDDPFRSYLAFGASGEPGADGLLTAQDVYAMRLPADLVVLSACRSASGTIVGDGVATFARAFLYAGAASLVASVWDVADEPSNRLLPEFYRAWNGGATKAASLRRAQLALLADLRRGRLRVQTAIGPVPVPEHPVFWAGFALFGEPD